MNFVGNAFSARLAAAKYKKNVFAITEQNNLISNSMIILFTAQQYLAVLIAKRVAQK